jgi:hypothetical protein
MASSTNAGELSQEQLVSLAYHDNPVNALLTLRTTTKPMHLVSGFIIRMYRPIANNRKNVADSETLDNMVATGTTDLSPYLDEIYEEYKEHFSKMYDDKGYAKHMRAINIFLKYNPEQRILILNKIINEGLSNVYTECIPKDRNNKTLKRPKRENKPYSGMSEQQFLHYRSIYFQAVTNKQEECRSGKFRIYYQGEVRNFLYKLAMYKYYIKHSHANANANAANELRKIMGKLTAKGDPSVDAEVNALMKSAGIQELPELSVDNQVSKLMKNAGKKELPELSVDDQVNALMASVTAGGGGSSAAGQTHFGHSGGRRKTRNKQTRTTQKR